MFKKISVYFVLIVTFFVLGLTMVDAKTATCVYKNPNGDTKYTLKITGKNQATLDGNKGGFVVLVTTDTDECPPFIYVGVGIGAYKDQTIVSTEKTYTPNATIYPLLNNESKASNVTTDSGSSNGTDSTNVDFKAGSIDCGVFGDISNKSSVAYYLQVMLDVMRYIAVIALIVLSILDFVKAVAAQDGDALKKAGNTFGKRLAFTIMIFFIPIVLKLILQYLGVTTCSNM
jgi:hypothetical protein